MVTAAGAALLLLPGLDDGLLGLPELKTGEIAPRTVKSPRGFIIEDFETTGRLQREARSRVLPTYDLAADLGGRSKRRIEAAFRSIADLDETPPERERRFILALGSNLHPDSLLPLTRAPHADELRDAAIMIVQSIYQARIVEDKALLMLQAPEGVAVRMLNQRGASDREVRVLDYASVMGVDEARARVDEIVARRLVRLELSYRRAVAILVKRLLKPNLIENPLETERRREAAERAIKTVVIPINPGEAVLRAGERVTERHRFILQGIEEELSGESRVQAALGSAVLIVLLVIVMYRFTNRSYRGFRPSHRDLAFLASSYIAMLLLTWTGYKAVLWLSEEFPLAGISAYRYAMPLCAGTMLIRFVVGAETAAAFAALAGLTAGWMMDSSLSFAAYTFLGSVAAASAAESERPRAMLFYAGGRASLAQALVVISLALLGSEFAFRETLLDVSGAIISGLLAAAMATLSVPLVEVLFGYTTSMKLLDLANLNHPLLRELLVEAPGTYHHSILVGKLAESAAKSVGANPLLSRVGAYYHDIGKIRNPRIFDENTPENLAGISPREAAKELKKHVADGIELAVKHRLGQSVTDIIVQHHGTGVVRTQYERASRLPESVSVNDFGYAGPKPVSTEAALVLLADVVEAMTRGLVGLVDLSRERIESVVRTGIHELLNDGQLDRCELTLRDLESVTRAFSDVLEERLVRPGRPTLSTLPLVSSAQIVRPPMRGEPN